MRGSLFAVAALALPAVASAQLAVRGETVHTMAGAAIRDGVVLVGRDGKIEARFEGSVSTGELAAAVRRTLVG